MRVPATAAGMEDGRGRKLHHAYFDVLSTFLSRAHTRIESLVNLKHEELSAPQVPHIPILCPRSLAAVFCPCAHFSAFQQAAVPAAGAIPGIVIAGLQPPESLQSQPPQSRPIRIVVQDVQVGLRGLWLPDGGTRFVL